MRLSTSLALAALGLAASALPAAAGTLLVPSKAYPTIQSAVNAAKPYDTVQVSAKPKGGVYNEAVTITTPHLTLQGQNNPVIDGTGLGTPAVGFQPGVYLNDIDIRASHVTVRGLTVQNAAGAPYGPGASGINVGYSAADGFSTISFSDIEISGVVARNNYSGITISGYAGANPAYGGTGTLLKGYRLIGSVVTGSLSVGAGVIGDSVLISGNQFLGNGGDGLDTFGTGITVSGNESASNIAYGMALNATTYNPAVNPRNNPNPAASAVTGNSIHGNQDIGLSVTGTQTISGNSISKNAQIGLSVSGADYSTVSSNVITGTTLSQYGYGGVGLSATYTYFGPVTISSNEVSGNAGDGIFLDAVAGSKVVGNDAAHNAGIGIHLTDYTLTYAAAPNTVTLNSALFNALFDASDDASAAGADAGAYGPTVNVWTKNLFGKTDPGNLSK